MSTLALLAQAGPPDGIPPTVLMFLGTICVVGFLITITIIGVKYATHERELLHAERLKALEKGILLDDVEDERRFRKGIMRLAFAIGVVVPAIAIIGATTAVINMALPDAAASHTMAIFLIWTGAAAVGVAGVASGAWLAQGAVARLGSGARRNHAATAAYGLSRDPAEATAMR